MNKDILVSLVCSLEGAKGGLKQVGEDAYRNKKVPDENFPGFRSSTKRIELKGKVYKKVARKERQRVLEI